MYEGGVQMLVGGRATIDAAVDRKDAVDQRDSNLLSTGPFLIDDDQRLRIHGTLAVDVAGSALAWFLRAVRQCTGVQFLRPAAGCC